MLCKIKEHELGHLKHSKRKIQSNNNNKHIKKSFQSTKNFEKETSFSLSFYIPTTPNPHQQKLK